MGLLHVDGVQLHLLLRQLQGMDEPRGSCADNENAGVLCHGGQCLGMLGRPALRHGLYRHKLKQMPAFGALHAGACGIGFLPPLQLQRCKQVLAFCM